MLIAQINPTQIILEVYVTGPDGAVKTDITTANVRVYHLASGVEVIDLISTAMTQVSTTNVWRYIWAPGSLASNNYIAEYTLIDSSNLTSKTAEDISIGYLESKIDTVSANVTTIKSVQLGRWKIVANQLILYKEDNTTIIATFNLFDSVGNPTSDSVTDRIKV